MFANFEKISYIKIHWTFFAECAIIPIGWKNRTIMKKKSKEEVMF